MRCAGRFGCRLLTDGVVFHGVVFRQLVAVAFFGDDVQQLRPFAFAQFFQHRHQLPDIVPVHRARVGKAEILKQRQRLLHVFAFAGNRLNRVFRFLRHFFDRCGQFVQHFGGMLFDFVQHAAHIAHHVARQIFGQRAHVRRNRHFVVVQHHQQVHFHVAGVVQRFKCLPRRHRPVADNGHAARIAAGEPVGHRHAQRRADGGGRMPHAEIVVFAFAAFWETGQPAKLADGVHAVFAPRQDFVRITLVPHVPN